MTSARQLARALLTAVLLCIYPLCAGALPLSSATPFASGGAGVELLSRTEGVYSLSAIRFHPCVKQSHGSSCGFACLANLLSVFIGYAADESSIERARDGSESADGSSLLSLLDSARRLGYEAKAYRMDVGLLQTVLTEIGIPVIGLYHSPTAHYVIAVAPVCDGILVFDPASGFSVLSRSQLLGRWSGYALIVDPGLDRLDTCLAATAAFARRFEGRHERLDGLDWIPEPTTSWIIR